MSAAESMTTLKNLIKPLVPHAVVGRFRARRWTRLSRSRGITVRYKPDAIEICRGKSTVRIRHSHEAYLMDMVTSFDYYFGAVHAVEGVADFSCPRHHRLIGFDDFPVLFPSIPEPYATAQQYLEFASLKAGDRVLDLGAYSGVTSVAFARAVGRIGEVFAFEPDEENFRAATETINTARSFGYPPVILIHEAVWCHDDGIDFSVEGAMGSSASSIVGKGRGSTVRVPTTTLIRFVKERQINQINFIKMDIEGAEVEVLDSSRELLAQMRPKIIIEPHMVGETLTTERCRQILEEIGGYKVRLIDQLGVSLPLITATPVFA
jgi:FkbM family methyltransferase